MMHQLTGLQGKNKEESNRKRKTEDRVIFLNPFIVCSSCKWKFVICRFVDEETNTEVIHLQTDQTVLPIYLIGTYAYT
jgi:hypothetical protein